ncbi:GNAT family N-acetyltransferase [Amphibacillus sp. Q70]|uniref:GNAT family N-acetyltransferase n=1 Tax=Amphibacillus sp. Q70 TaxID=3453416 RepID=UPI003F82BBE6
MLNLVNFLIERLLLLNIDILPPTNIKELTLFLEKINNQKSYHIGFCGEDSEEIYDTLSNDFSDLDLHDSFLVAYHHSTIIGAIGIDIDLQDEHADVWGPFVEGGNKQLAQALWDHLILKTPKEIKAFSFFLNKENQFARDFVLENKGVNEGLDIVLHIARDKYEKRNTNGYETFTAAYRDSFIKLHNQVFPKTYFNANTILSRLNDNHHLFLVKENGTELKGYVYIEASPKHKEGNIEYVAVSDKYRGAGVGKTLITAALNQLFSYQSIEEITICVSGDNVAARQLYQSVGFEEKYHLISYEISRN